MKYLIPPAVAVLLSTAGVAYGCDACGMPPHEVKIATMLALCVSSLVAFGAVLLARPRRRATNGSGLVPPR